MYLNLCSDTGFSGFFCRIVEKHWRQLFCDSEGTKSPNWWAPEGRRLPQQSSTSPSTSDFLVECFAVKLQKCFVDYETLLDFPLAWCLWFKFHLWSWVSGAIQPFDTFNTSGSGSSLEGQITAGNTSNWLKPRLSRVEIERKFSHTTELPSSVLVNNVGYRSTSTLLTAPKGGGGAGGGGGGKGEIHFSLKLQR